jgi:ABC-type cobalt transport system substrate-binding protein
MRARKTWSTRVVRAVVVSALFVNLSVYPWICLAEGGKWSGVDETVVEKYAKEHGREARRPLVDTDRGDLLLFLFLLAGAVGGFVAGYYWRALTDQRDKALSGQGKDAE